jgi:hypothetical protein
MFKPRIRISRACAARLAPAAPRVSASSPLAVPARQQQQQQIQLQQQQRSIHASPIRRLHSVPPLGDDQKFETGGVPGLLSPEAFNIAYNDYQAHVVNKLNQYTAGTNDPPQFPVMWTPMAGRA